MAKIGNEYRVSGSIELISVISSIVHFFKVYSLNINSYFAHCYQIPATHIMRFLSADIVFPIHLPPVANGIVVVDDNGKVEDLLNPEIDEISTSINVERFKGILCPGFVNTHCHLELSHLKGRFTQKMGLPFFIGER